LDNLLLMYISTPFQLFETVLGDVLEIHCFRPRKIKFLKFRSDSEPIRFNLKTESNVGRKVSWWKLSSALEKNIFSNLFSDSDSYEHGLHFSPISKTTTLIKYQNSRNKIQLITSINIPTTLYPGRDSNRRSSVVEEEIMTYFNSFFTKFLNKISHL
jgi:hypothetical protein